MPGWQKTLKLQNKGNDPLARIISEKFPSFTFSFCVLQILFYMICRNSTFKNKYSFGKKTVISSGVFEDIRDHMAVGSSGNDLISA